MYMASLKSKCPRRNLKRAYSCMIPSIYKNLTDISRLLDLYSNYLLHFDYNFFIPLPIQVISYSLDSARRSSMKKS